MHMPGRMNTFLGDENMATPADLSYSVVVPHRVSLVKHDGRLCRLSLVSRDEQGYSQNQWLQERGHP